MIELSYAGNKEGLMKYLNSKTDECQHICSGNCRRVGCNCDCGGEWHCLDCKGTGICTRTEWTGTDTSYEVGVRCKCTED